MTGGKKKMEYKENLKDELWVLESFEIKPKKAEKLKKKLNLETKITIQGQEINPNKWYGTCYGKDLAKEIGIHYE